MSALRTPRGFKIINRVKNRNLSLTLLAYNGHKYRVLINSYWLGLHIKHRSYQFDNLEQAQNFYRKVISRHPNLVPQYQVS